jgi:prepilin-type N-terminal cleavage/methylation domain-containing protein
MRTPQNSRGFTLMEVMLALALISIFAIMAMNYSSILNRQSSLARSGSTKNRILSGVRDLAGLPAALRMSMRASDETGAAVNPDLLACAGGNPMNHCDSDKLYSLTLYSPIIQRAADGSILGVSKLTAPFGDATAQPVRIDTFGAPCTVASPECPLLVYTSFKAQCGPPPAPAVAPSPVTIQLVPQGTCTVADVIEVTYYVKLDQNVANKDPALASFVSEVTGSVVVPVVAISGNVPQ